MKTHAHEKDSSIARLTKISSAIARRETTGRSERATLEPTRTVAEAVPAAIAAAASPEAEAAVFAEAAVDSEAADGGVNCGWGRYEGRTDSQMPGHKRWCRSWAISLTFVARAFSERRYGFGFT